MKGFDQEMIEKPQHKKHYESAKARFLQASIEKFFENEFFSVFGPAVRDMIAKELTKLVLRILPPKDHVQPGQIVWNAVSVFTRADNPRCIQVPVVLTLISESDIDDLCNGVPMSKISKKAIARITKEAYHQGALLSMRDIGLFSWRDISAISKKRKEYEREHDTVLPHTGNIHDMGSCITHKSMIVRKVIVERKDPTIVSRETNHTQQAVDKYLKDYNRVKICYRQNKDLNFISQATGLSKNLVKQYLNIISEISEKDLKCKSA
jgi:hypothetical protein